MSQILLIVPRHEPGRYAYFQHACGGQVINVIEDRRVGQRRRREVRPAVSAAARIGAGGTSPRTSRRSVELVRRPFSHPALVGV